MAVFSKTEVNEIEPSDYPYIRSFLFEMSEMVLADGADQLGLEADKARDVVGELMKRFRDLTDEMALSQPEKNVIIQVTMMKLGIVSMEVLMDRIKHIPIIDAGDSPNGAN